MTRDPVSSDTPSERPQRPKPPARRRLWLRLLLTGLAMMGSTTAFVLGWFAIGAALGVVAGLVSSYAVWGWIQSNSDPER